MKGSIARWVECLGGWVMADMATVHSLGQVGEPWLWMASTRTARPTHGYKPTREAATPRLWRLVADPPTLPNVLIFSAAMGAAQWQTSRMHAVWFRRNQMKWFRSKRADPTRPTRASFASSSPTAATTWTSPISLMRRSRLAAYNHFWSYDFVAKYRR